MKEVFLLLSSRSSQNRPCLPGVSHLARHLFFLLAFLSSVANAQDFIVKGTVNDETGSGMPGVNIVVKGTTNGTTSDEGGNFSLSVPGGDAVLTFSFIGYAPKEVSVGGRTSIAVQLDTDITSLSEVVVVGYGTQRQEAVTGSVVSIHTDQIREVPAPNLTQALQGRLAGVEMSQTSSKPGAAMQIRIRGTRSLSASNDPLIVLDGIPFAGSITDINPNDVKSVDILKDASSTAIYGSRGANGVILITTIKGKQGQKPQFTYNGYFGVNEVFSRYPMMDGEKFAKLRADAGVYQSNGLDESNDVNTDWQDLLYGSGAVTSHDIGVTGGTNGGSYNFGIGYYKNEAVIPSQYYDRFSLRASLDQKIGNYLRLGFTTNTNYSVSNGANRNI